jgi:uncharacterized protein
MWQSLRVPFLTILFALLSLFVFTKLFGPIPFSVNSVVTNKNNLFTVTGRGEVAAVPDTALISLGVNKTGPTVEGAKEEVNKIINQITMEIKQLGVEEKNIKTTNFTVTPNIDFRDGSQRTNGYIVNANIEVRVKPVDRANNAIDVATRLGANQIGSVQFVLNDEDRKKLEMDARKEAISEAKEKAASIAQAAGIKLGRIIDVQESSEGDLPPVYSRMEAIDLDQKQTEPTELNPGENKVVVNVSLSYETN